jgi:hypothetical protein
MEQKKKGNVVWGGAQWMAVAKRSYVIKECELFTGSDLDAIRHAQNEVLPVAMHRNLTGMHVVKRIPEKIWPELKAQGFGAEAGDIRPIEAPTAGLRTLADESTGDLFRELARRLDFLNETTLRAIMRDEANRVLEARLPASILRQGEPQPEQPLQAMGITRQTPRHRVCVIGLLPGQDGILTTRYAGLIDFHWLDETAGVNRVRETVERMDYTIRSRWAGHVGNMEGQANFASAAEGGMAMICRLIEQRFNLG